jgi:hypothetical protein
VSPKKSWLMANVTGPDPSPGCIAGGPGGCAEAPVPVELVLPPVPPVEPVLPPVPGDVEVLPQLVKSETESVATVTLATAR